MAVQQIGYAAMLEQFHPTDLIDYCVLAEQNGFSGVMAAPIYQVNPLMGSQLIIVVFAVVVIGGMGSIVGAIVAGFGLGVLEGITKLVYPDGAGMVVFVVMLIVLAVRPQGLFGSLR